MSAKTTSRHRELGLVGILGLVVGLVSFEQLGITYLMPFIQPALQLSNMQVGLLMSAYWVPLAISSFAAGALADHGGRHKLLLIVALLAFAACSILSGLVDSFATLLAARALMGFWEGALLTISQSIVALESSPERRSTNMGIVGGVCPNILGIIIAPLVLVQIASLYEWRTGFFIVILPALACALLIARFVGEPQRAIASHRSVADRSNGGGRISEALTLRNVWLCAALCCLYVVYMNLGFTFLPLYYVNVRRFSAEQMSFLMGLLGISAVLYALVLPLIANRVGRKPVMIVASGLSLICPLAALYFDGSTALLALLLLVGWALSGSATLFAATIPAETVPAGSLSTVIGLIIALGVLIGGLAGPSLAGWSADRWGLQAPLLLQVAAAVAAAAVSAALHETAPRRISSTRAHLVPAE